MAPAVIGLASKFYEWVLCVVLFFTDIRALHSLSIADLFAFAILKQSIRPLDVKSHGHRGRVLAYPDPVMYCSVGSNRLA